MRNRKVNGEDIPLTGSQESALNMKEAEWANASITRSRPNKYEAANAEYVERGIILTGAKARGSSPKQALNAMAIKETHRGGPDASALADLHDKLEILKDAIEAATTQAELDLIDVADNVHWT